jgi:hypothetical protein
VLSALAASAAADALVGVDASNPAALVAASVSSYTTVFAGRPPSSRRVR